MSNNPTHKMKNTDPTQQKIKSNDLTQVKALSNFAPWDWVWCKAVCDMGKQNREYFLLCIAYATNIPRTSTSISYCSFFIAATSFHDCKLGPVTHTRPQSCWRRPLTRHVLYMTTEKIEWTVTGSRDQRGLKLARWKSNFGDVLHIGENNTPELLFQLLHEVHVMLQTKSANWFLLWKDKM